MSTYRFVFPLLEPTLVVVCVAAASTALAETPRPTPTNQQSPLSAYAGRIVLNRPLSTGSSDPIVISTETLLEMSRSGTLVKGLVQTGNSRSQNSESGTSVAEKARWQKRVRSQRAVIAKLESRRARIEKAIDLINDSRLTPRTIAQLERAQVDLQFVDEDIRNEYRELARIIREARQHGAEPGWFR